MQDLPKKLEKKLLERKNNASFRTLNNERELVDFSSNDYLGFSRSEEIYQNTLAILDKNELRLNGSCGSRLLTGNHKLFEKVEQKITSFHQSQSALIFNSGYDANLGLFSAVLQREDIVFYDELSHASIRDGIKMSHAKAFKFKHNDQEDLKRLLDKADKKMNIFVVTESIFSMDGDSPDLLKMVELCETHSAYLIVDEAHAVGVVGKGKGLVQSLGIEDRVFARLVTFGKALGCHGAAILGSESLRDYLINFSRSFIYTTALSPHAVATILAAYERLEKIIDQPNNSDFKRLNKNISYFQNSIKNSVIGDLFLQSDSAIFSCIIQTNERVTAISEKLKNAGFDVKPIRSPTVPKGLERIRICIHSFNTEEEINKMFQLLEEELKER